jgi:hypothetical protein
LERAPLIGETPLALIHFAITLFVSAFILFLVQPLIGKLVLPKLGGTPQVWNTCMVFFQMVLLLGYGYTHFVSTKLKPRAQVILHSVVLLLPFVVFYLRPFWFIKDWIPNFGGNPIFATLLLLATVVGIPFFVVSTTAPLLQKWFGFTGHEAAKDPYFLYGASNLGSMLSLLVYPALIEPLSFLNTQAVMWMGGYALLVVLVFVAVLMVWKPTGEASAQKTENERPEISTQPASGEVLASAIQSKPSPARVSGVTESAPVRSIETVDFWRRLRWVALAAVPSSMMLGITSHITTDLSPIPLFWLIPLAFYLLSFILVFARWPFVWVETPHSLMLLLQPVAIALMILFDMVHHNPGTSFESPWPVITFNLIGFVLTVMVCHGELAKDRPSVRYLTDFYLMMSVGGVVGGLLNALIAPLFPVVFELNLAIIAACLLRPNLPYGNWLDNLFTSMADKPAETPVKGKKVQAVNIAKAAPPSPGLAYGLDIGVGIAVFALAFIVNLMFSRGTSQTLLIGAFAVTFLIAMAFFSRGLRFGLAIAGIILAFEMYSNSQEGNQTLHRSRSYFGVIRVKRGADRGDGIPYTTLIHGHINHGQNYVKPNDPSKDEDFSRLATTYYHRKGPVGIVMEKFNWFKDPNSNNTYWGDARMPAGLVAQGAFGALGASVLPLGSLVEVWTEPPFATIGLGTGTMASYGRPFQHVHFYEIDDQIRRLSIPDNKGRGKTYFTYLEDAKERGSNVQVLMGDARQRMAQPYYNYHEAEVKPREKPNGGPEKFYHMMVVDAFSSDAIPAHLLTKEAFKMYFDHLTEDGILCVHTSNRYVDLPRVVADVAEEGGYVATVGKDSAPNAIENDPKNRGHFTSEWVMVARKAPKVAGRTEREYLKHLTEPAGYKEAVRKEANRKGHAVSPRPYWSAPATFNGRYLWTDDYYNLLTILRVVVGGRDD